MAEVALWVQTTKSTVVQFNYWSDDDPELKFETEVSVTRQENEYTIVLLADKVEPGKHYTYELILNREKVEIPYPLRFQTQKLWQWREDPPEFSFAMGSGTYINEQQFDRPDKPYADELTFDHPYGKSPNIFTTIYDKHPDFMLWLGDNVYLREADWNSRTGIFHRYTHTRSAPELQPLLGAIHHYAIWDDHDYGPNNSDRSFYNKEISLEAFQKFFPNPGYGKNGKPGTNGNLGTTAKFSWADVDFFLLDNRYFRSPNNRKHNKREILGEEQIEWLIDGLVYSTAPFKIVVVGGQFLNPVQISENHSNYPEETNRILELIAQEKIESVLFITGDRHFTELTKMERNGSYPLYDYTISALTSGSNDQGSKEPNNLRVKGTMVTQNNFAVMKVTGTKKDRTLSCTVYDIEGKELWSHSINENELK